LLSGFFEIAGVKTAFFFGGFLPPPTAFAFVLAGSHRFGARFATDGNISPVMERVVRDLIGAYVIPDLLQCPIRQRVELGEDFTGTRENLVILNDGNIGAGPWALIFTLSGYPCIQA